jgi:hypothetical protein
VAAVGGRGGAITLCGNRFRTALDVAGIGRYARKVVTACKRERARRLHTAAPAELAELSKRDPAVLVVNSDDMAWALACALAWGGGAGPRDGHAGWSFNRVGWKAPGTAVRRQCHAELEWLDGGQGLYR